MNYNSSTHEFADDFDIILGKLYTYITELELYLFLEDEIHYEISYPKISYIFIKLKKEVKQVMKEYKNIFITLNRTIFSHNKYIVLLHNEICNIGKRLKTISSRICIYNFPYIGKQGIIDILNDFDILGDTLLSLKCVKGCIPPKPPPIKPLFRSVWGSSPPTS
jgi:hypothetical protein